MDRPHCCWVWCKDSNGNPIFYQLQGFFQEWYSVLSLRWSQEEGWFCFLYRPLESWLQVLVSQASKQSRRLPAHTFKVWDWYCLTKKIKKIIKMNSITDDYRNWSAPMLESQGQPAYKTVNDKWCTSAGRQYYIFDSSDQGPRWSVCCSGSACSEGKGRLLGTMQRRRASLQKIIQKSYSLRWLRPQRERTKDTELWEMFESCYSWD